MNITQRKPFKLVSQDQQIKKGITAGSLDELTNKGMKLHYTRPLAIPYLLLFQVVIFLYF
jgi:hypothetical protein